MIDYSKGIKYLQERSYELISTNLADKSIAVFDIATTYDKNAIVRSEEKIYMSRSDANKGNEPFVTPLFWRRIGTINTEAWRDDSFFTQSWANDEIVFVVNAPAAEVVAFSNLEATHIVVEQLLDDGTVVNTIDRDLATVVGSDWIAYWFFDPILKKRTKIDIPLTEADRLRITIQNPGSVAKVGNMQLGTMGEIGCEAYGTTTEHRLVKSPSGEMKPIMDVDIDATVSWLYPPRIWAPARSSR